MLLVVPTFPPERPMDEPLEFALPSRTFRARKTAALCLQNGLASDPRHLLRAGPKPMNRHGGWFESLDELRRRAGRALDRIDLGPEESEFEVVLSRPAARLRAYGDARRGAPVLFIVPAPIKRPYIWDISPERSVVRKALDRGYDVYLVEWTDAPGNEGRYGLEDYALDALRDCIDRIGHRSRSDRVFLAGHSLGGTFAAIYAACRPDEVRGLVLIEAPLHFAEAAGAFGPLLDTGIPASAVVQSSAGVPGSLLSLISVCAAPGTFQLERYADLVASLSSRADFETHWRVERWALDELALPPRLFEELVEQLYREDRFMRGTLTLGGKAVGPGDVAAPLFAVYAPDSRIIPPASVLAFCACVASQEKVTMPYLGDKGVALQHVGALVGENAHRRIWPSVFEWLDALSGK